jgi:hypothetical protein
VDAAGKRIALFNVDGTFYAIDETCTHRGGPLSEGMLNLAGNAHELRSTSYGEPGVDNHCCLRTTEGTGWRSFAHGGEAFRAASSVC